MNKFIECAMEGEADYIVSGDEHLLSLKHYKGIQIVNVKDWNCPALNNSGKGLRKLV